MNHHPILVTGATGKIGSRVAKGLEAHGRSVRPASRRGDPPFDWSQSETWPRALDGAGAAFVTYQPDFAFPGALQALTGFFKKARLAGLGSIVMLTGRGERHAERAEQALFASGIPSTVVRSAWFAQNFSEGSLRDPVAAGVLPMPGKGVSEPIVDLDDVADVIVEVLTGHGHEGQIYDVTGPRLLSFSDMAAGLTAAFERAVEYVPITFEEFHNKLAATSGAEFAGIVTAIARETFDGRNAHLGDGVERVLGRKPRDFTQFALRAAQSGAWSAAA